jgi:hypothetical protein
LGAQHVERRLSAMDKEDRHYDRAFTAHGLSPNCAKMVSISAGTK